MLEWANHKESSLYVNSSQDQIGLKASETPQQHDALLIASIAENDSDVDKIFFDLPFTLFERYAFLWESKLNSITMMNSISEFAHHYHLPKYLLFHNLKISIPLFATKN